MIPGSGFADVGSGDYSPSSKKHEYAFTFAEGIAVGSFSILVLDWGDFLPYGACPGGRCEMAMTAYNTAGEVVDQDVRGFTTSQSGFFRTSSEYGDMRVAGDACLAEHGEPGRAQFQVSGPGIVRVELGFTALGCVDPHIALLVLAYSVAQGVAGPGYWRGADAWPVSSLELGGVEYSQADATALLESRVAGDVSFALAKQLVAAKLNAASGNDASCVLAAIADADAWLASNPIGSGVKANGAAWQSSGEALRDVLEEYNQGLLCAPPME
jgi:hypothetical protein